MNAGTQKATFIEQGFQQENSCYSPLICSNAVLPFF